MKYNYTLYWINPLDPELTDDFKEIMYFISKHNTIKEVFEGINKFIKSGVRSYKPITLTEEELTNCFDNGERYVLLTSQYKDECDIFLKREIISS